MDLLLDLGGYVVVEEYFLSTVLNQPLGMNEVVCQCLKIPKHAAWLVVFEVKRLVLPVGDDLGHHAQKARFLGRRGDQNRAFCSHYDGRS